MEKREPSYTVDGNISWHNHYEEYGDFLKKKKKTYHMIQLAQASIPIHQRGDRRSENCIPTASRMKTTITES